MKQSIVPANCRKVVTQLLLVIAAAFLLRPRFIEWQLTHIEYDAVDARLHGISATLSVNATILYPNSLPAYVFPSQHDVFFPGVDGSSHYLGRAVMSHGQILYASYGYGVRSRTINTNESSKKNKADARDLSTTNKERNGVMVGFKTKRAGLQAVVAMEAGKWLRSRGTLVLREIGHATVIGLALVPLPPSLLLALIPRASFSTSSYILNIAPMLPSLIPFPMPVPLRVGVECDHYIRTKAISFRRPRVVNSEFDGAKCRLSLFGGLLVLHHSFASNICNKQSYQLCNVSVAISVFCTELKLCR